MRNPEHFGGDASAQSALPNVCNNNYYCTTTTTTTTNNNNYKTNNSTTTNNCYYEISFNGDAISLLDSGSQRV